MDSTLVIFKVICSNEPAVLRRLTFPKIADISYQALYSKLSQLQKTNSFKIRYTDEDGDAITIDNDLDLREAIEHNKSLSKDSSRLVIKLILEEVKPSPINKELPELPKHISLDSDPDKVPTSNEKNAIYNDFHEYLFESVLNPGIKNLQDIVQNIVTQVGSTLEREFVRDSLNLNLNKSMKSQSPEFIIDPTEDTKDTTKSSSSSSTSETRQVQTQESHISSDPVVHEDVMCDCCEQIIRGVRLKCDDCPNYDLCQTCKNKSPSIHANHTFIPIPYPVKNRHRPPRVSANIGKVGSNYHSATCDYCESVIIGIRHKCINCPDFDLCNNCIALAPTQHPGHTFMKIHRAGDPDVKIPDSAFHPGIRCDGCRKAIHGVRYKCGNCLDFDLCGNCEANPISKHDENHVFIKIKKPVSQRLRTDAPLLHDFYSKVEQKTGRSKDCKQQPQSNNVHKEMESVPRQTSLVNSNSDASNSNPFIPLTRPIGSEDTTRAPIDLYNYPLGAKPTVSSSSHEKLAKETIQTQASPVTPYSPLPLSNVTTITSQDEACDVPFKISEEITTEKRLSARFVSDVNVPDGTTLVPQAQFRKVWAMSNDGDIVWPENTMVRFVGGHRMFNDSLRSDQNGDYGSIVGSLEPGKNVYVSVDLQAPAEPGKYISFWRLTDNEGNLFGHKIWCEIKVEADDQSSSMSSSMIFPVLNYDQKSTQSAASSVQSPVSTSEDDKVIVSSQNSVKSTATELQTEIVDLENNTTVSDGFKDEPTKEIMYQEEISKLADMGFTDTEMTYNLLLAFDGNIDKVIDSFMQWE
ncbi:24334_t:CDS:10 [Dentiscutata erythropus]|uniref:24334_t:CDS:1 n=1 Tax=Dentiscutata erythropus TaxID=1348616 RepID=A0A9N9H4A9_9GLOM|nr:24334_t:CDS:10 [Dentiscutata erythropus]